MFTRRGLFGLFSGAAAAPLIASAPLAVRDEARSQLTGTVINIDIDARGASDEALAAFSKVLREQSVETELRIIDGIKRGRYGI